MCKNTGLAPSRPKVGIRNPFCSFAYFCCSCPSLVTQPFPLFLSLSTMATYPPTCSNTNASQGMNMANSIANLRLKAKEYSLNQVPTVN